MILEPRFLEKPAFAVEQSRNAARKMAEESHNALFTKISQKQTVTAFPLCFTVSGILNVFPTML